MAVTDRFKKAWNAFRQQDQSSLSGGDSFSIGAPTYSPYEPARSRHIFTAEKTIVSSIYTRLSIDTAGVEFKHVEVDDNNRYLKDSDSALNDLLRFGVNLDQTPEDFRQDIALTLFTSGVAAIVPVDTSVNPNTNEVFDIYSMRVGTVMAWHPEHVRVSIYNEKTGMREELVLPKDFVALVKNPFYSVMNEPNSTLQRLIRKLNMLDAVDEQSASGKLDLIIQLPYIIKNEARQAQAEKRRKDIEFQLKGSQYGIAYTDGTEKITQLNRPAENNLLKQIEYLTNMLYQQLGLTEAIMNGTADEKTMLNYQNRTIIPIVKAITSAMQQTFIGLDRYKDNERMMYFSNPFKFVPLADIAEISDKFTRNEIATANEIRGIIGFAPSADPKADKLQNSNMPQNEGGEGEGENSSGGFSPEAFSELDSEMNSIFDELEKTIEGL